MQLYCNIDSYGGIASKADFFLLMIMKNAKVVSHPVKLWKVGFLNFFSKIIA